MTPKKKTISLHLVCGAWQQHQGAIVDAVKSQVAEGRHQVHVHCYSEEEKKRKGEQEEEVPLRCAAHEYSVTRDAARSIVQRIVAGGSDIAEVNVWSGDGANGGCIFSLDAETHADRARLLLAVSHREACEWAVTSRRDDGNPKNARNNANLLFVKDILDAVQPLRTVPVSLRCYAVPHLPATLVLPPSDDDEGEGESQGSQQQHSVISAPRVACITVTSNVGLLRFTPETKGAPEVDSSEDGSGNVLTGVLGRILLWLGGAGPCYNVLHMAAAFDATTTLVVKPQPDVETLRELSQHFPTLSFTCNGVSCRSADSNESHKSTPPPFVCVNIIGKEISAFAHRSGDALAALLRRAKKGALFLSPSGCCISVTMPQGDDTAVASMQDAVFEDVDVVAAAAAFGRTWNEYCQEEGAASPTKSQEMGKQASQENKTKQQNEGRQQGYTEWWATRRKDQLLHLAAAKTPRYVYDAPTILTSIQNLKSMSAVTRVNYAMKANPFPPVLKLMHAQGMCFDCVSWGEVEHLMAVLGCDFDAKRVVFTPNFAPLWEYQAAFDIGCGVTVDNMELVFDTPELFAKRDILVRIDPDTPHVGHHAFVQTSGSSTKFGLSREHIAAFAEQCRAIGTRVVGLHAHVGSGIFTAENWANTARFLATVMKEHFVDVTILDVGGGFGVPDTDEHLPLDLGKVNNLLGEFRSEHPGVDVWIEPGRFLVARAGVLLAKITQTKQKCGTTFLGIDTGINSLIRYPLYGSFHEIVNLSKLNNQHTLTADVVGPICETGDILGKQRSFPPTGKGDMMLIANAGAYGRSMSSSYNMRKPAEEVLLE